VAITINQDCTSCETLASAYQFVFQSGGHLELTADGRKRLADIVKELRRLRDSGLSVADLQAQIDLQAKAIFDVFNTELCLVGDPNPQGGGSSSTTAAGGPTSTSGGPSTTAGGASTSTTSQASTSTSARTSTTASTGTSSPGPTNPATTAPPSPASTASVP